MFSRMGSNHDLLNQNQRCYHYTTGKFKKAAGFSKAFSFANIEINQIPEKDLNLQKVIQQLL